MRLLAEQHATVVGEDADRVAVQLGEPGDERRAVQRLELVEVAVVDQPGDHIARIERHLRIDRWDAEQVLGIESRWLAGSTWPGSALALVEAAHDLTPETNAVELVDGEVVGKTTDSGVHLGAAERLVVALLAGGHLHQRRAAEEHLRSLLDHHDVVAHSRHVGAAGRGVAEHDGDGRDSFGRQLGDVVEGLPAGDEDLALGRQVGAAGLDQVDHWQRFSRAICVGPQRLAHRHRVRRAAAHASGRWP